MEHTVEAIQALSLTDSIAFAVREGRILQATPQARGLGLLEGTPVAPLLGTGAPAYESYRGGSLSLTLDGMLRPWEATVTRIGSNDIFLLTSAVSESQLQAMALASVQIRKPLTELISLADRALPRLMAEGTSQRQQLCGIHKSLNQLHRIACNLSDVSRYQADTHCHQLRDVCAILQEVFDNGKRAAELLDIHMTCRLPHNSIYTLVDTDILERAVYNILSNALKYTPRGGSIEAELSRSGDHLLLSVTDTGPGIDPEVQGNLFTRYLRRPGLEDGRAGIGLGLSIVRAAAAVHSGTALIDHPAGKGTRVTLTIAIRQTGSELRTPQCRPDYAGERDRFLLEFSDVLPVEAYDVF